MKKRIICIGNRFLPDDRAGFEVFCNLRRQSLPTDIELVDGGLGGLNLLRYLDDAAAVVFVDAMTGSGPGDEIRVFKAAEITETHSCRYDHASGLPYLLKVLPQVCEGAVPDVFVVGVSSVGRKQTIARASRTAVNLMLNYQ